MQVTVTTIIFGLPTGRHTTQVCLTLPAAALTVRELIACKVRQEFEECLMHLRPGLGGEYLTPRELLQPAAQTGRVIPGAVADEIQRAQQAFAAREYMVVLDNRRVWKPDEEVRLHPGARVEFIKILLSAGG